MHVAGFLAVLALVGCSSAVDERTPVAPLSDCVEQVEVARFTGTYDARTQSDVDEPGEAMAAEILDSAGIATESMSGGLWDHGDGTCGDLYTPRGPRCGWMSVMVAVPDAARARKLLAAHGMPVVQADRAASAIPAAGLRAACAAHR